MGVTQLSYSIKEGFFFYVTDFLALLQNSSQWRTVCSVWTDCPFIKPLLSIKKTKCSPGPHHLEASSFPHLLSCFISLFVPLRHTPLTPSLHSITLLSVSVTWVNAGFDLSFVIVRIIPALLVPGSRTCSCWTREWFGPPRKDGWCLTWLPPATTGFSTLAGTLACSWPWRAQTVRVT